MKAKKPSLRDLFVAHSGKVSDKWDIYISEYDRLFQPYRDQPVRLLEIGIQNGGSLEVWSKFFAKAIKLVGCDIDPACAQLKFDDSKISVVVANANSDEAEQEVLSLSPSFDIIIDDGSHQSGDIVRSFVRYFSHIKVDGLFIAEDLHCSYWQDFEGGIYEPNSSITFFKLLADVINHEHWGVVATRRDLLKSFNQKYEVVLNELTLSQIHSVEFINSICIIRKAPADKNVLGKRFITGLNASVWPGALKLHGSSHSRPDQSSNLWSSVNPLPKFQLSEKANSNSSTEATSNSIFVNSESILNLKKIIEESVASSLQSHISTEKHIQDHLLKQQSLSEQLVLAQQRYEALRAEHGVQLAELEKIQFAQLDKKNLEIQNQLVKIEAREKHFSVQLFELQKKHDQQQAAREQVYLAQINDAHQQTQVQLLENIQREKDFSAQLRELQQKHDQQKIGINQQQAVRNQAHFEQIGEARQKINAQLLLLAEREKTFSTHLLQNQSIYEQQKSELSKKHTLREIKFNDQLTLIRQEIEEKTKSWHEKEKQHLLSIHQLHLDLARIHGTRSWRWTAIFRVLNAHIFDGKSYQSKTYSTPVINSLTSHLSEQPSSAVTMTTTSFQKLFSINTSPFEMNPTLTNIQINSLADLLDLHDEQFIHSAYHCVLGRDPDTEGFKYYLKRLRGGVSKIEILSQLRLGKEGKSKKLSLLGLDNEVKQFQRHRTPFLGTILRKIEAESFTQNAYKKLLAIENKLYALDSQLQRKLTETNRALLQLESKVIHSAELVDNDIGEPGMHSTQSSDLTELKIYDPIGDRYAIALAEVAGRFCPSIDGHSNIASGDILISVVMPVYKVPLVYLENAIDSVRYQTYTNWQLCIVDDGSNEEGLSNYLHQLPQLDRRIKVKINAVNSGISTATNDAISLAEGDFIAFLDNDDLLTNDALHAIASKIQACPDVDLIYSDECKVDESGVPVELFTKPDWSPSALFNCMYTGHLSVYKKSLIYRAGGMRTEFDFSQDYDLALRVSALTTNIQHIDRILYGWRMIAGSGAQGGKPYARASNVAALQDALTSRGIPGKAFGEPTANHFRVSLSSMTQKVSIVIPSDNLNNIQNTIASIEQNTIYKNYEIIVVTNSKLIKALRKNGLSSKILLVPFDHEFNFSAKCNVGAAQATGEIIVFYNDDVRVVSKDWVEMILECFVHPSVGIVGPKLLYENYLIQHAGMVTGVRGLVGTAFHCLPHVTPKHFGSALWMREVSLICGACLAIRKKTFNEMNGFDAVNAPISHSDVDLCFRVRDAGYSCLYTPHATLIHIGHLSIAETEKKEILGSVIPKKDKSDIFLLRRWGHHTSYDPYFPPAMRDILYHDSPEYWQLYADVPPAPSGGKDILLVSHDLSGSGAPRIVFEMARVLREAGHFVVVASPADGVFRKQLNDIGIPVIVDELLLRQHSSLEKFAKNFDLVIANTVVTWPAVKLLSKVVETYWYIHEISLLQHLLNVQPEIKDAFHLAKTVWVGSDHAAQLVLLHRSDVLVLKYGVNPLSQEMEPLSTSKRLKVALFGSYEPRKGQDLAIAAFALLPIEYRSRLRLNFYGRVLDENLYKKVELVARNFHEVTLKTEIPYERYVEEMIASDAILIASRDDTLPFVSIDALGAGKLLMCTNTTGTSSYIQHGISGFISKSADAQSIADMLREVIDRSAELPSIAENGRTVFNIEFSIAAFTKSFFNACAITIHKQ
jgi:O-antigen biosynthesis protein